jgi:hypothetical protein
MENTTSGLFSKPRTKEELYIALPIIYVLIMLAAIMILKQHLQALNDIRDGMTKAKSDKSQSYRHRGMKLMKNEVRSQQECELLTIDSEEETTKMLWGLGPMYISPRHIKAE